MEWYYIGQTDLSFPKSCFQFPGILWSFSVLQMEWLINLVYSGTEVKVTRL